MAAQPSVVLVAGGGQPQPSGSLGQRAVDGTALDVCDDPRGIRDTCWQCRLHDGCLCAQSERWSQLEIKYAQTSGSVTLGIGTRQGPNLGGVNLRICYEL